VKEREVRRNGKGRDCGEGDSTKAHFLNKVFCTSYFHSTARALDMPKLVEF
jgi:hypothetical protein